MRIKGKNIALGALAVAFAASLTFGAGAAVAAEQPKGDLVTTTPSQAETVADNDKAYSVGKEDSTVGYVAYASDSIYPTSTGIQAELVSNDTLTLNNVVNLEEMAEQDKPFITIMPITHTKGSAEFTKVTLEVVDVYDPTNYLRVTISANPMMEDTSTVSYFLAGASNGQKLTGLESGTKLHVNNEFGQYSVFDYSGSIMSSSGTGLFYNVEENAIYAVDYRGVKRFIIDFDDPAYFGTYVWDGFTSNEVYCRLRCDGYKQEKATILVSQYGNFDLTNPAIQDDVAPALTVDFGEYTAETVPSALKNESYKLFPATAFDAYDGEKEVDVKVYTNYYSSAKKEVTAKNGKFTPRMQVPHHIVYSVSDNHGNVSEKVVAVEVVSSSDPISITFNDEIPQTYVQGNKYELPSYLPSGGLGNVHVDVAATLNGEPIEIKDGGVRAHSVGTLQIVYTATDYVEQTETVTHEIEITAADKPTFIETPLLPKYLIAGNRYTFPKLNAYNYVTGTGEAIETTVSVKENGTEKTLSDNVYVAATVSQVEVVYTAKVGDKVNTYNVTLPVYSVKNGEGDLDMSKYFLCDENGTTLAKTRMVDLVATADSEFEFLNSVASLYFRTEITLTDESANASKLHVYLTDVTDESKQIKFTYILTGSTARFYVNDHTENIVEVSTKIKKGARLSLTFEAGLDVVYYDVANDNILAIPTYLDGSKFEGFSESHAYVSYALEGVKENTSATVSVTSLNGHYFGNAIADYIEPSIEVVGSIGGEYKIGSVVALPEIIANDVLSGDVDAYVTLTSPSGAVITSTSGVRIENLLYSDAALEVALNEYGKYTLDVVAKDGNENESMLPLVFWVVDMEKPTLTLSGTIATTAKVGDNVSVPTATAKDNVSEELTVYRYVFTPGGVVTQLKDDETGFRATEAGVYTVVYMLSDAEGNFVSEYYKITVTEA